MKKLSLFLTILLFTFSLVHAADKPINVFLAGPGLVGSELLQQINERFSSENDLEIRVVGIANSRKMLIDASGIDLATWKAKLEEKGKQMSMEDYTAQISHLNLSNAVFVDCTSSQIVSDSYAHILKSKTSIATANKKANSGWYAQYCILKNLAKDNEVSFLYDANVGAGLPIIKTLKSVNRCGDRVVKLEAILSGTLSYLFNTFDGSVPFSQILREAQAKGFTEPDPRDDLNGLDMARKFLILARESGLKLEMKDIVIEPFLPQECFEAANVAEFYQKLEAFDDTFTSLAQETLNRGEILRFMGTLEEGKAILSLQAVNAAHPFYTLSDTDNISSISTQIYNKNPVVIKGPGAGASVTAANVLSNIVEACQ